MVAVEQKRDDYTVVMNEQVETSMQKFTSFYAKEDIEQVYREALMARGTTKYESRIRIKLINILESCHERINFPMDLQKLKEEIKRNYQVVVMFDDWIFGLTKREFDDLINRIPTREDLIQSLFKELYLIYKLAPTPREYMRRLVLRLADEDLKSQEESVRLIILKQFLRHTNYKTKPILTLVEKSVQGSRENLIQSVSEEIFEQLVQIKKEFEANKNTDKKAKDKFKDAKKKYALLQLADDLATGKFRTNGRTKTDLYMFAMAFGMTFNIGEESYELEKDVEKNLFHDYYNDNLLRYLLSDYIDESTGLEAEPSGEGINYKNFAEVIYLYYIHKKELLPKDKIKKAEKLINECVKRMKEGKKDSVKSAYEDSTELYKRKLIAEMIDLEEEDLLNYIHNNFHFPENIKELSKITVATNQNTAKEIIIEIVEDIEMLDGGIGFDEEEFEVLYDVDNFDFAINFDLLITGFEEDSDFIKILQKLDDKLRNIGKKGLEQLEEKDKITRTQLVGLCYYYYRIGLDEEMKLSLPEIYDEFCDLVNPYLEQARFQRISEKNIFDMFITFSLYLEQIRYNAIDEKEIQQNDLTKDIEKLREKV